MSLFTLILKEIGRRKAGFALACGAVALAAAGVVFTETVSRAFVDAMRKITLNMGTNILVLPEGVDSNAFWSGQTGTVYMDESLVKKLSESKVAADHFIGKLQKETSVEGHRAVLTGIMREIGAVGKKKKNPMGWDVPRGECYLGAAISERLGEKGKPGRKLRLLSRDFEIGRVPVRQDGKRVRLDAVPSIGPVEDIRIFINIKDHQEMLGKPGKIHAIDALGCLCPVDEYGARIFTDIEDNIVKSLADQRKVTATTYLSIAAARMEARLGAGLTRWLTVAALSVLAVLVVAFYMLGDVRARREELGMFLAVGFGPGKLVAMFLVKLVLVALAGAVLGFAAGSLAPKLVPPELLSKVAINPQTVWAMILWTALGALAVSLLAGIIPTLLAVRTDPAEVLRRN